MEIDNILDKLKGVEQVAENSWKACCPAHNDTDPSLSVAITTSGKVLLYCHAGCEFDAITKALDLPTGKKYRTGIWHYKDEFGNIVCSKHKIIEKVDGKRVKKMFWEYRLPDGSSSFKKPKPFREIPFNLNNLVNSDDTIYMAEGEKCACALSRINLTATSFKNWKPQWNYLLEDRDVVMFPDNDEAGRKQLDKAINVIKDSAKSIKVVKLDVNAGEDVFDYVEQHGQIKLMMEVNNTKEFEQDTIPLVDIFSSPPQTKKWIFHNLIRRTGSSSLIMCHAKEKSNKTWYIYDMVLSMISKTPFMGEYIPSKSIKKVLVLSPEGGIELAKERMWGLALGYDINANELKGKIIFANLDTTVLNLNNDDHLDKIRTIIYRNEIDVVVIDPIVEFHDVEENDNSLMANFFARLRTLANDERHLSIIYTHHNSKNGSSARGASSICGKYDFAISLNKHDNGSIHLSFNSRNSQPPLPIVMNTTFVHYDDKPYDGVKINYQTDYTYRVNSVKDAIQFGNWSNKADLATELKIRKSELIQIMNDLNIQKIGGKFVLPNEE